MALLNLDTIVLPDLSDLGKYPTVAHAPQDGCTEEWKPHKECLGADLHRVRPYGLPTVPLATLTYAWARRDLFRIPAVPLIPPSLGTLCPTINVQDATVSTGSSGRFELRVDKTDSDSCRPLIVPTITFPCTLVEAGAKTITMVPGGTDASWTQTIAPSSDEESCLSVITDVMTIPCSEVTVGTVSNVLTGDSNIALSGGLAVTATGSGCNTVIGATLNLTATFIPGGDGTGGGGTGGTGTGSAGVSAGFFVGSTASHDLDPSNPCCTTYPPGAEVPVWDKHGLLGAAGTQLDPLENVFINQSDNVLTDGDPIFLGQVAGGTIGDPIQWVVLS